MQPHLNVFALLAVAFAASACSPGPEPIGPTSGPSNRPHEAPPVPATSTPDVVPAIWERWQEVSTYRVAVPRAPSQHLAADHEGETLASDSAAPYPDLGPAAAPAVGAALLQRLYAPGATVPETQFAMVKRAPESGGWEYLVLDRSGVVTERGVLDACARCHAEAPHDGLFGRAQ
jgi:hypothetical protein